MGDTPMWLLCPVQRRENGDARTRDWRRSQFRMHELRVTGRWKPNPSRRRGPRTSDLSREIVCSCGKTFWSTHIDGERLDRLTRGYLRSRWPS
jgi:hypothetical protein